MVSSEHDDMRRAGDRTPAPHRASVSHRANAVRRVPGLRATLLSLCVALAGLGAAAIASSGKSAPAPVVQGFGLGHTELVSSTSRVGTVLGSLSLGPQAMEGALSVAPGTVLKAGYDFSMTGKQPASTVWVLDAQVKFDAICESKKQVTAAGTITVAMADNVSGYAVAAGSKAWMPTGDQQSAAGYQGSVVVDNRCNGAPVSLRNGGAFSSLIESTDPTSPVTVRWHYSAGGSAGGWSGSAVADASPGTFSIAGTASGIDLGGSITMPLTIANPNKFAIQVLEIDGVTSATSNAACNPAWLELDPYIFGTGPAVLVGPKSSLSAPSTPAITAHLRDTTVDQSGCKNSSFTVTFTGTATPVVSK